MSKAVKVQTSESGRRYVAIREVVRGQLERIRSEKEHQTRVSTKNNNGCMVPSPKEKKDK
jgi:hypothetical protein